MSISRAEIGLIILTLLMGAGSIWLGTWDPLWIYVGVGPEIRGTLTIALSVFIVLAGFLPVIHLQQSRTLADAQKLQQQLLMELKATIPHLSAFEILSADKALAYLAREILAARSVWNTRLISEDVSSGIVILTLLELRLSPLMLRAQTM